MSNAENPVFSEITLTREQCEIIAWALPAMKEHFEEQVADGELPKLPLMPVVDVRTMILPLDQETIADLLYRVGEQLPEMAEAAWGMFKDPKGTIRAAENLCSKINAVVKS